MRHWWEKNASYLHPYLPRYPGPYFLNSVGDLEVFPEIYLQNSITGHIFYLRVDFFKGVCVWWAGGEVSQPSILHNNIYNKAVGFKSRLSDELF